jgi:hypothetical protein
VKIDVQLYNDTKGPIASRLELFMTDQEGHEVKAHPLLKEIPPGLSHRRVAVELGLVGRFRANCRIRGGPTVDVADYLFAVYPRLGADEQAILYSVGGKVGRLPAQRVEVPWQNAREWYAEPAQHLVVNDDGTIYLFACDGVILRTSDGGLTWDQIYEVGSGFASKEGTPSQINEAGDDVATIRGPLASMGVMRDGSFLCVAADEARQVGLVNRSGDKGRTWTRIAEIPQIHNYQPGPVIELDDGTYLWPVGLPQVGSPGSVFVYRSTDQGKSWKRDLVARGGEPYVRQLRDGRLLATVRFNVTPPRSRFDLYLKNKWQWLFWQRVGKRHDLTSYVKGLILLDSEDGGMTWDNPRQVTYQLGEMHGMTVCLPDGRIVLLHVNRTLPRYGGERGRVSRDGGYTWQDETYYLHTTQAYPGYSASCVLPPHLADGKPGMILTIVSDRSEGNWAGTKPPELTPPSMQAVRWRPLP